jgi:hypothetical protein
MSNKNSKIQQEEQKMSRKIVMTGLHNKGGCGKTELATLIIDAMRSHGVVKAFDNDSEAPKLSNFSKIEAEHIQLHELDCNGHIRAESLNINRMDAAARWIENGSTEVTYIDNGSPSFQPFLSYFSADAVESYGSIGVDFIVVTIVTADRITHRAPVELLNAYGNAVKYIIVENEHFGKIDYDDFAFAAAGVEYQIFKMEKLTAAQNESLVAVRDKGLLLSSAITSQEFSIVQKSRLNKIKTAFESGFFAAMEDLK